MRAGGVCVCVLLAVLGPGLAAVLEATGQENPVQRRQVRHRLQQQGRNLRERRAAPEQPSEQPEVPEPLESEKRGSEGPGEPQPPGPAPGRPDGEVGEVSPEWLESQQATAEGAHRDAFPLDKPKESVVAPPAHGEPSSARESERVSDTRSETSPILEHPAKSAEIIGKVSEGSATHGSADITQEEKKASSSSSARRAPLQMDVISQHAPAVGPPQEHSLSQSGGHVEPPVTHVTHANPGGAHKQSESQRKQEERRKRLEKLQRDLLERRQKIRRKAVIADTAGLEAPRLKAEPSSPTLKDAGGSPGLAGDSLELEEDRARSRKAHRLDEEPRRSDKDRRLREQEAHGNSLSEDWDPNENSVEWDGLVCPAVGDVSLLSAQCRSDKDCPPAGERCCKDRWGLKRCVQGVEPILPEIPHEPFFGVIARVCPSQSDTLVEPWAVTNCTTDDDCWPRVCCADGSKAYCRTPQIEWEKLPGQRFVAPLRLLMSYLQCTPPPPPMFDLFPKPCRNTLDCFPNLCCQEHGNKVCRPPKRSLLALLATIGHSAGFNLRSQQQQQPQPT